MKTPDDFTELEYARQILEFVLGWPAKGNLETVADCLRSIAAKKRLSKVQAHAYLSRAIKLAEKQGEKIDKFWLNDGSYMHVRPSDDKEFKGTFVKPSPQERALAEQSNRSYFESDEYKQFVAKFSKEHSLG
jgi:hypothetical protein